jgi:hypothetical protein
MSLVVNDWNFVIYCSFNRNFSNYASVFHDLFDSFKYYHPSTKAFTFSSTHRNMSMKLDHYYVTKNVSSFINNYKHVPFPSSIFDHEARVFFIIYAINAILKRF